MWPERETLSGSGCGFARDLAPETAGPLIRCFVSTGLNPVTDRCRGAIHLSQGTDTVLTV